jgi:excisionase family DNA binding protein
LSKVEELLTCAEAAQQVDRSRDCIRKWISRGWLKAIQKGRFYLIDPADLRRAVRNNVPKKGPKNGR